MKKIIKKIFNNKKIKLIISILIISLLIFSVCSFFYKTEKKTINIPAKPAEINNINGKVEIYRNDSWIEIKNKQEIFLNEKIKISKGSARISLYGRANIYLEEKTTIEIISLTKNNLIIKQITGITHNSFSKNNQYSFSVETPKAIAIVHGTNFDIKIENESDILFVNSGEVLFKGNNNEEYFSKYDKGIATTDKIIIGKVTKEEIEPILNENIKKVETLKKQRLEEIEKNTLLLNIAKKTYGLTKEDIIQKLDDIDKGYIDDTIIIEKAPFKKDELRKIKSINDNIKYRNSEIKFILDKFNSTILN